MHTTGKRHDLLGTLIEIYIARGKDPKAVLHKKFEQARGKSRRNIKLRLSGSWGL